MQSSLQFFLGLLTLALAFFIGIQASPKTGSSTLLPNSISSIHPEDKDISSGFYYQGYWQNYTLTYTAPPNQICNVENVAVIDFNIVITKHISSENELYTADLALLKGQPYQIKVTCCGPGLQTGTATQITPFEANCMLGSVELQTADGPQRIDSIELGTRMVQQQDGTFSTVRKVVKQTLSLETQLPDRRLFCSNDSSVVLTYWHKVLFEGAWVLPETCMREVTSEHPDTFDVWHLVLEKASDTLTCANGLVVESLPFYE